VNVPLRLMMTSFQKTVNPVLKIVSIVLIPVLVNFVFTDTN
jgi:hypothetical protein